MIRIPNIKLHINHTPNDLRSAILKKLRIPGTRLLDFIIVRKSIDARDKSNVHFVYTVDAALQQEQEILKRAEHSGICEAALPVYQYPVQGSMPMPYRPIVVGSGPCGLFAAYFLAKEGYRPIVLERGEPVEDRVHSVERFWKEGILDPSCNIQFGEGGAGTFSDGKLYTGIQDPVGRIHLVLKTFVEYGAPAHILYQHKPHLGTDVLQKIVVRMRNAIIDCGGEFRFRTCFHSLQTEGGQLRGILTEQGEMIPARHVLLAVGHSARDTFDSLMKTEGICVQAKPFAVGVRVEHRQKDIDLAQFGPLYAGKLPPADYKLTYKSSRGNSVYSFCMCPGGYVVNSSSEPGRVCINGMSYSGRSSDNANSAIVVSVMPSSDPAENIAFQRSLEENTFREGNGCIVSQRLEDFQLNRPSVSSGSISPVHKGKTVFGNIHRILPPSVCADILEAMPVFGKRIKGFDDPDVLLSAVETRTSSPVRILRNENMESGIAGVYPLGEGAGYAGGITSAAVDGIKAFETIYAGWLPADYNK